jgi:hypothetical protein
VRVRTFRKELQPLRSFRRIPGDRNRNQSPLFDLRLRMRRRNTYRQAAQGNYTPGSCIQLLSGLP